MQGEEKMNTTSNFIFLEDFSEMVLLDDDLGTNRMKNIALMTENVHLYVLLIDFHNLN